jgi:hypothetical protein
MIDLSLLVGMHSSELCKSPEQYVATYAYGSIHQAYGSFSSYSQQYTNKVYSMTLLQYNLIFFTLW